MAPPREEGRIGRRYGRNLVGVEEQRRSLRQDHDRFRSGLSGMRWKTRYGATHRLRVGGGCVTLWRGAKAALDMGVYWLGRCMAATLGDALLTSPRPPACSTRCLAADPWRHPISAQGAQNVWTCRGVSREKRSRWSARVC